MQKSSKRQQERVKLVDRSRRYGIDEAVEAIKKISDNRYDETISLNFQLGVDASSGSENVRGAVSLPHGSGKTVKVICFCKGEDVAKAKEAGADEVGAEELVKKVQGGWMDFDVVVAHPNMMRDVSKLGRVLGPKGLMPSPKTGTVTNNVAKAIEDSKAGRIEFKSDKTGGLHAICGKLSFSKQNIIENAKSVVKAIQDAKPAATKGDYIKAVSIATSQGPGFRLATNKI